MPEIHVNVSNDHLQNLAKAAPIAAILELIWNALDSDATSVIVEVSDNGIGGVESIVIKDNGTGISEEDARFFFANLGGSWKKIQGRSRTGARVLHGKEGKGRFRAFALGEAVTWRSVYGDGQHKMLSITGVPGALNKFDITEPIDTKEPRGTIVLIDQIVTGLPSLLDTDVKERLAEHLAPYLIKYPVTVSYRGQKVDPRSAIKEARDFKLTPSDDLEGKPEVPTLRLIEWHRPASRELHLCDSEGFSLEVVPPRFHTPGYEFTAYISSRRIRQLYDKNELPLWEVKGSLDGLLDEVKQTIKNHRREMKARGARQFIEQLKQENLYPYKEPPKDAVETAKRQMFDTLAVNLVDLYPKFEQSDHTSKSLSLSLIAHSLEENPKALQKIIGDVLKLTPEKREELAEVLKETSLDHIISATKIITDRLKFLDGLEELIYSADLKPVMRERAHLHRIIEGETWLFGEEYSLAASDKGLTEVLRKHRALLGEEEIVIDEPVVRYDGKKGIVDLMLSRALRVPNKKLQEHLIVELKRPTVKIDDKAILQLRSYAKATVHDERFQRSQTVWTFVAVSNELSEEVEELARQPGRTNGIVFEDPDHRYVIYARRWSEIIEDARSRLQFVKEKLNVELTDGSGLEYMRKTYAKYLPDEVNPAPSPMSSEDASDIPEEMRAEGVDVQVAQVLTAEVAVSSDADGASKQASPKRKSKT